MSSTEGRKTARDAPIEIDPEDFRALGHEAVDLIAEFLATLRERPVYPGESPAEVQEILGDAPLPEQGADPGEILREATELLVNHSSLDGHPRFFGYILGAPAPIGALGDLLAAAVNPNVGGWPLAPIATEMEAQTIRWVAELVGYPSDCGGLFVSGGNMANFIGIIAARKARVPWNVREEGVRGPDGRALRIYASRETHNWVEKAADLVGIGTNAIRWIPTDGSLRMDPKELIRRLDDDIAEGDVPVAVVGTAGSVSTGSVDPLDQISTICKERGVWFHVDGAYGGFAACLPDAPVELKALAEADSVAVDPHKWLYSPFEAACALVRDERALHDAFRLAPPYYHFSTNREELALNYFEYGLQNSRGFKALKVWLGLRQVGRAGYVKMIGDDIALAIELAEHVGNAPELELYTQELSIVTFRYVPPDVSGTDGDYLNELNTRLLSRLEEEGEIFLSNALIEGDFVLRACIVNFRTSSDDVATVPEIVTRAGRAMDAELRPTGARP